MALPLIVEIMLSALLAATLVYCALLERRLTALRKGQDGLKDIIAELNGAIANAGASMRMLKAAASGAAEALDERVRRAHDLIDELSLLTVSGERIATRIERGAPQQSQHNTESGVFAASAGRLEALKPQILRSEALRSVR